MGGYGTVRLRQRRFRKSRYRQSLGTAPVGVAVRCAACARLSVNLVSVAHLDVPFHNDRHVGVVEHFFSDDARQTVDEFTAELYSARFDARRLLLD